MNPHPLIIGHRGAAGLAPENTLSSIQKAMETGAHRIEIDVHQTADNKLIVIHDDKLNRTTNLSGKIKHLSWEYIKQADAGSWFDASFQHEKIPLLEDVLSLVNARIPLHLEIKHSSRYYPGIEINIYSLLKKHKALSWCYINSFDNKVLKNFHAIDSKITLHKLLIFSIGILQRDKYLTPGRLRQFHYIQEFGVYYRFVTPRLVRLIHQMGKKINVWTVNEPQAMLKMARMNVDGIITDYPHTAMELFYGSSELPVR